MEMFPVLKIAVGAELRGRGGGSFGTWVGRLTPFLFLLGPLRGSAPWIESIETGEGPGAISAHSPSSDRRGGPEVGRGLASRLGSRETVTDGELCLPGWSRPGKVFSPCLWERTGPGNSWGGCGPASWLSPSRRGVPA